MRIPRLPDSVRSIKPPGRVNALQQIVNAELNRRGICPVAHYMAGPAAYRVAVRRRHGHYHAESNFENYNRRTGESVSETYLEAIVVEAIEDF